VRGAHELQDGRERDVSANAGIPQTERVATSLVRHAARARNPSCGRSHTAIPKVAAYCSACHSICVSGSACRRGERDAPRVSQYAISVSRSPPSFQVRAPSG